MQTPAPEGAHARAVSRVLVIILILNVAVMAVKAAVGWWTGSLSVLGDAVHSTVDALNNVVALIAIRLAHQPADREHPYGHGKFETLAAFAIAGLLVLTAFGLVKTAVSRLLGSTVVTLEIRGLATAGLLITWMVNWFVAVYERRAGTRLDSELLLADAAHTLSDVFVTAAILVSFSLAASPLYPLVDAGLSLGIAVVIGWTAYGIFARTLPILTDRLAIAPEVIEQIVRSVPGALGCHAIRSRRVGPATFIEMHVEVAESENVKAHAITEEIEARLELRIGTPCTATIHVEPVVDRPRE